MTLMTLMRRFLQLLALLCSVGTASAIAQDFTTTPNLALKLPKVGSTNWGIYVNQDFTSLDAALGQFHGGFVITPFSVAPVFDLTKGNTFQITLSGNVTSSTVNQPGVTSGQIMYLLVCQDVTGSRSFTFPASFQSPLPTVSATPSRCSASTWIWSATFHVWINSGGTGGGGGGGTPNPPNGSLQYDQTGSFGGAAFIYNPTDSTTNICTGTCSSLTALVDSGVGVFATDASSSVELAAQSDNNLSAAYVQVDAQTTATSQVFAFNAQLQVGGSVTGGGCYTFVLAGTPPCSVGFYSLVGDKAGDLTNGQDAVGFGTAFQLNKGVGKNMHNLAGLAIYTPVNNSGVSVVPVTETATNLWGIEIQDLQDIGSTMTAGIHIELQTNPSSHAFAIKTEANAGPSQLTDSVSSTFFSTLSANPATAGVLRLSTGDGIDWRNNANGANVALTKNASDNLVWPNSISIGGTLVSGSGSGTATLPANTGTVAELNLAQTWTANQSVANGVELRFFSTNATNYAGFKGGASTINLVWLFPSTDSTGTQCLSSNGSLQLAWSACSAGTGTPGGADTNIQYRNAGVFAGSGNFTFNGTDTVTLGLLNTTKGIFKMTGNTSGTVTIQPLAVAGTPTIVWPNTSGTVATTGTAPLAVDATTGAVSCATCTTNAAAATANQLLIGGGSQAIAALGTLGTTTTVLHGNGGGAPTFAAVNLATETTGVTAIANGGSGQSTAQAAFNALSPITSAGDLILGTGVNTAGRLGIGGNGLCLVSNGTTAAWASCATGAVGGTAVAGQATFWNGSGTIAGNANWLYAAGSGQSLIQGANNVDAFYMKRFTDSASTGNFLHCQTFAANADICKLDVNGNFSVSGSIQVTSATIAGAIQLGQGTAPGLVANTAQLIAPTVVAASGEQFIFPGNPATGFIRWTNVAGAMTGGLVPASGVGDCTPSSKLVIQTNDNAAPTCSSVLATMFTSQGANQALIAPSGSSGIPTFRLLVSADLPPIVLNSTANGGVTNILQITNGGTNASTATTAFNNLSPMTTAGDIIYGGTAGAGTRLGAGSATQLLHSGTTPSWSAISLTADVSGVLPIASGGTNASSGLTNSNGAVYSDGTKLVSTATGGAGTLCLTSTNGGTPVFGSCSGGASTTWSNLASPGADLSLAMSTFNTLFTHGIMTGTRNIMEWTDGASTSTGSVLSVHTNASSTMKPFTFTALGTANGIQMDSTGAVAVIGTGHITADKLSRTITTTTPLTIGGGGSADLTADRTLACATCVTSGSSLTTNALVMGSGGAQGTATLANGTAKQVLVAGAPPTYIDFPETFYIPSANCVNGVAASAWSTSATPAALCRAGTNNKDGLLSPWGASDIGYFRVHLPNDWDSAASLDITIDLTSTDATNGHTIIMQASTSCGKGDGSTTDDVAFNAAQSFGTITLNGNANRTWNATLTGLTKTGCIAGSTLWVKISRTTDTATNVGVYGATVDVARLIAVQAN